MKKTVTAFVAAAMLATVPLAATTQDAAAWHKGLRHGIATGIGVGIELGVIGALTRPRQQVIVQQPPVVVQQPPRTVIIQQGFSQAHYNECFRRAPNSYNPNTNTYVRWGGQVVICRTPY